MIAGKKVFAASLAIFLIVFFASCASQKDVPLVLVETIPATTTTLPPPKPTTTTSTTSTTTSTTTTSTIPASTTTTTLPALPWIDEPALRNLFGTANLAMNEADSYAIDEVLPNYYRAVRDEFDAASAHFDSVTETIPYDGTASWPVKEKLENTQAVLSLLLSDGLPVRARMERYKTMDLRRDAILAGAHESVPGRFDAAETAAAAAETFTADGYHSASIDSWRRAALLYASSLEKTLVESIRAQILAKGYETIAPADWAQAEKLRAFDAEYWESGTDADLSTGTDSLIEALPLYERVLSWGFEYRSHEASSDALSARSAADAVNAAPNVAAIYAEALSLLRKADTAAASGDFRSSLSDYGNSADLFRKAQEAATALRTKAEKAHKSASEALTASSVTADRAGAVNNPYLASGSAHRGTSILALRELRFLDSLDESAAVREASALSDAYVDGLLSGKSQANAIAAAEKAVAEQTARAALQKAEEENRKSAQTLAKLAAEKAVAEKMAAENAAQLAAERAARIAAEKAAAEKAAAEKAAALAKVALPAPVLPISPEPDTVKLEAADVIAKAVARQSWALLHNAVNNYPEVIRDGSAILEPARAAFARGDYGTALAKAGAALETMSVISEFAPLPAFYKVRWLEGRRDSFTKIAGYPFIYGDAEQWTLLYDANRRLLREKANPDLILPGQVLSIPSLSGERREGTWSPKKTYPTVSK
ncbi:MAG: hypothetical protein WBH97_00765 [Rectinemataceae bacterium]